MQFRLSILTILLAVFVFVPSVSADPPTEPKEKSVDTQAETKPQPQPLSREEQQKRDEEEKARLEALRQKVVSNISRLVEPLNLTRSQNVRVNALLGEDQFETAIETFKSTRQSEIHDHAHNVAKITIPGIMRKFMPSYMQKKMMAQRRAQKRRGPPSRDEIASIQKDAQSKMHPAMQKIVMPSLESLSETRLSELVNDEKVLTRMMGDRIFKSRILDEDDSKNFSTALEKAGYPATLTTGEDSLLNDRMNKMVNEIDIAKVAQSVGL
jgi:hypothetical protein